MDALERKLLNLIQGHFPIHTQPYRILGEVLGLSAEATFAKIQHLYDQGVIRRLGGVFDSRRLGYFSTLCTAKVPEEKIAAVAAYLEGISGVTHNYLRNHSYNMWFTLITPSQERAESILQGIREAFAIEVFSLPALQVFKIQVDFDLADEELANSESQEHTVREELPDSADSFIPSVNSGASSQGWFDTDLPLIRVLQRDLPHGLFPFRELARQLDWSEALVIKRTESMLEGKVIRRFGAVLRHQKAGFLANAMGVWQVEDALVQQVGEKMARFREVSHCYQRPTLPDWPYNLFTMIHGRNAEDCYQVMQRIAQETGILLYDMLFSIAELKKSSMEYFLEEE